MSTESPAARVIVEDTARASAFRDYVLRLGGVAVVGAGDVVEVSCAPEGGDLCAYVENWSAINGVAARLVERTTETPARRPALIGAPPPRLGDLLVARGWITQEQLADALVESRTTGDLLGRVLLTRGLIFQEELARTLADQWSLPYVSLMRIGADPEIVRLLPKALGLKVAAVPVRLQGVGVQVAFADPSDRMALEAVQEHLPAITLAVAELSDIEQVWKGVAA